MRVVDWPLCYVQLFSLVLVAYTFNTTRIRDMPVNTIVYILNRNSIIQSFIDNCYTYKYQIRILTKCQWKVKPNDVRYVVAQNIGY